MSNLFTQSSHLLKFKHLEDDYENLYIKLFRIYQSNCLVNEENITSSKQINHIQYEDWLLKRLALLTKYSEFLRICNVNPNRFKEPSIELLKGQYDSLIRSYPKYIKVYSKYGATFSEKLKGEVILQDITVIDGVPNYVLKTADGTKATVPFNVELFDIYYVHNPYTSREEKMCQELVSNPNLTTVYGLYGLASEKDIDSKIDDLRSFSKEIPRAQFHELRGVTKNIGEFHIGLIYKPRQK